MDISILRDKYAFKLAKGSLFALAYALIIILIFAAAASIFGAGTAVTRAVNIFVRLTAAGVCAFFSVGNDKGLIKGGAAGISAFFTLHSTFWLIAGNILMDGFVLNLVFSTLAGIIFGIIFTNLRKSAANS